MSNTEEVEETVQAHDAPRVRHKNFWAFIGFLTCVLFGGYFYTQFSYNPSTDFYPYMWRAPYLKAPFPGKLVCFRKVLFLSDEPVNAFVAISARNFYQLKVNGKNVKPFFRPSRYVSWMADQSAYTEIGYPRRDELATIYDIRTSLIRGRNVISVKVQADDATPMVAVDGRILGTRTVDIGTDESWRCAPEPQTRINVKWEASNFEDADWLHAVATLEKPDVSADGDISIFEEPVGGIMLRPASTPAGEVIFRGRVNVPASLQTGWMRLSTSCPYDLSVNGRMVYSNSLINRYDGFPWTKRGEDSAFGAGGAPGGQDPAEETDAYARIEGTGHLNSEYPSSVQQRQIDNYLIKDVFRLGTNEIQVALHDPPIRELRNIKEFWLNGRVVSGERVIHFNSDLGWESRSLRSERWLPAVAGSPITRSFVLDARRHFPGKLDPGIGFSARVLYTDGFLLLVLLITEYLAFKVDRSVAWTWSRLPWNVVGVIFGSGYFLQVVFASSTQTEFFQSPGYAALVLAVATGAATITLFLERLSRKQTYPPTLSAERNSTTSGSSGWQKAVPWLFLVAISSVAAAFYARSVGASQLLADEYVSILASKGILRHGIPIYDLTGIVYTRSSLYHYLLALVMLFGGVQNIAAFKLFSGLWMLLTVGLVFFWARELKGNKAAVLAALLTALSPFTVFFAREIRFYTQLGFFTTLTFFLLWGAIRNPDKPGWRVATMLSFACAYLSHQFAIAAVPAIFGIAVFSGQLKLWLRGWPLAAFLFAVIAMALDAVAYFVYCQTALPYVDVESVSLLAVHTDGLEMLPSMLLSGYERTQLVVGVAYLAGAVPTFLTPIGQKVLALPSRINWNWPSFLYAATLPTIAVTTLIASRPTPRYIVHLYPLVALTAACVVVACIERLKDQNGSWFRAIAMNATAWACAILLFVSSYRPERTWNTTIRSSERDLTFAIGFLKEHALATDKLIVVNAEASMVAFDRCDYMWRPRRGSVFKYIGKDGVARERNSAGIVIDNADRLRTIMGRKDRIWIVAQSSNLEEGGSTAAGELAQFVNRNFKVATESLGMTVLFWDPNDGHYRNVIVDHGYARSGF